jgi:hypothetical protein
MTDLDTEAMPEGEGVPDLEFWWTAVFLDAHPAAPPVAIFQRTEDAAVYLLLHEGRSPPPMDRLHVAVIQLNLPR